MLFETRCSTCVIVTWFGHCYSPKLCDECKASDRKVCACDLEVFERAKEGGAWHSLHPGFIHSHVRPLFLNDERLQVRTVDSNVGQVKVVALKEA